MQPHTPLGLKIEQAVLIWVLIVIEASVFNAEEDLKTATLPRCVRQRWGPGKRRDWEEEREEEQHELVLNRDFVYFVAC